MKLETLIVKNYRTLEDITLHFSKNYCTISGKNNAGKSSIIRLLNALFRKENRYYWRFTDENIDYKVDKTQWVKELKPIEIEYIRPLA